MAGSKNNPDARKKTQSVIRMCERCKKSGEVGSKIERVLRIERGSKRLIWRCKDGC